MRTSAGCPPTRGDVALGTGPTRLEIMATACGIFPIGFAVTVVKNRSTIIVLLLVQTGAAAWTGSGREAAAGRRRGVGARIGLRRRDGRPLRRCLGGGFLLGDPIFQGDLHRFVLLL